MAKGTGTLVVSFLGLIGAGLFINYHLGFIKWLPTKPELKEMATSSRRVVKRLNQFERR